MKLKLLLYKFDSGLQPSSKSILKTLSDRFIWSNSIWIVKWRRNYRIDLDFYLFYLRILILIQTMRMIFNLKMDHTKHSVKIYVVMFIGLPLPIHSWTKYTWVDTSVAHMSSLGLVCLHLCTPHWMIRQFGWDRRRFVSSNHCHNQLNTAKKTDKLESIDFILCVSFDIANEHWERVLRDQKDWIN